MMASSNFTKADFTLSKTNVHLVETFTGTIRSFDSGVFLENCTMSHQRTLPGFKLNNSTVKVIQSNVAENRGTVFDVRNCTLTVDQSTIFRNGFTVGGHILKADNSTVSLTNCTFLENSIDDGTSGGFQNENLAFIKIANTKLEVSHSHFDRNNGTLLSTTKQSIVSLQKCAFAKGAVQYGAFMMIDITKLEVAHSNFTRNNGTLLETTQSVVSLQNCVFSKGTAQHGAVIIEAQDSDIMLEASLVTQNTHSFFEEKNSLVHVVRSHAFVQNCSIQDNKFGSAGLMQAKERSVVRVTQSLFHKNMEVTFVSSRGMVQVEESSLWVNSSSLQANNVGSINQKGALVYSERANTTILASNFSENEATTVSFVASNASVTKTEFRENRVKFGPGVVDVQNKSSVIVTSSSFLGSIFSSEGFMQASGASFLSLDNCTLRNNAPDSSSSFGGIIQIEESVFWLVTSTLTGNSAGFGTEQEAIVDAKGSNISIASTAFGTNRATLLKGRDTDARIYRCLFVYIELQVLGAPSVLDTDRSNILLEESVINHNSLWHSGITVRKSILTVTNCSMNANGGPFFGGDTQIIEAFESNVFLKQSSISNNTVTVLTMTSNSSNILLIENCNFDDSLVEQDTFPTLSKYALHLVNTLQIELVNTTFSLQSGSLFVSKGREIHLTNTEFHRSRESNSEFLHLDAGKYNISVKHVLFGAGDETITSEMGESDFMNKSMEKKFVTLSATAKLMQSSTKQDSTAAPTTAAPGDARANSRRVLYISIGVVGMLLLMLFVAGFFVLRRKRSKVKTQSKQTRRRRRPFDAYVSYTHANSIKYVKHTVIQQLEKKSGLKLLIHERDFLVGLSFPKCIQDAIDDSNGAIFLVSRDFNKSEWCKIEFKLCLLEHIKDPSFAIFVVMMEPFENLQPEMDNLMKDYLKTNKYFQKHDPNLYKKVAAKLKRKAGSKTRAEYRGTWVSTVGQETAENSPGEETAEEDFSDVRDDNLILLSSYKKPRDSIKSHTDVSEVSRNTSMETLSTEDMYVEDEQASWKENRNPLDILFRSSQNRGYAWAASEPDECVSVLDSGFEAQDLKHDEQTRNGQECLLRSHIPEEVNICDVQTNVKSSLPGSEIFPSAGSRRSVEEADHPNPVGPSVAPVSPATSSGQRVRSLSSLCTGNLTSCHVTKPLFACLMRMC